MSGMFNNGYIKYRKKVDEYLQNPDPKKLEKLFEDIKAASFMGELEESDADYLISELPIQTDNDLEFTYNKSNIKHTHPLDQLCIDENIYHQKIKPKTLRHNGKVERSHRNDNERFYSYLTFYSLEDLKKQAKAYLKRSNNIPM